MVIRSSSYWGEVAEQWAAHGRQRLWRQHSDAVNLAFLGSSLPRGVPVGFLLKTDAFDEAVGVGVAGLLSTVAQRVVLCDVAVSTLGLAQARHANLDVIAADVRDLPFAEGAFDVVVSLSTLDHFDHLDEMEQSLAQLRRILRPGGTLLLTLDNAANPVVALRNGLPARWHSASGLVPYRVGVTCGPHQLIQILARCGFEVSKVGAILHTPRVLAIAAAWMIQYLPGSAFDRPFLRVLRSFEYLAALPSRFRTGYFISIVAARR